MTTKIPATHDALAEILREVDDKLAGATGAQIRGKHLRSQLDLDSLDIIKFILLLEERYGLRIPDEDIDGRELLSVDNLVAYLSEHVK